MAAAQLAPPGYWQSWWPGCHGGPAWWASDMLPVAIGRRFSRFLSTKLRKTSSCIRNYQTEYSSVLYISVQKDSYSEIRQENK